MKLIRDSFLTEILKKEVFNITDVDNEIYDYFEHYKFPLIKMYCVKLPTFQNDYFNFLIEKGFKLICTEITFSTSCFNYIVLNPIHNILDSDICILSNPVTIIDIAEVAFNRDRFHLDNFISEKKANLIKIEWVKNALSGKRGSCIAVAYIDDVPAGFIIVLEKDNKVIIDLIAVDPKLQWKGIGSDLIRWLMLKYNNKIIQVGTQIDNISSIALYNNFGINKIIDSKYVLHLHIGG